MRATGTITWAGAVILTLLFMTAPCWAADNPDGYNKKHTHQYEQEVLNDGFVVMYQVVNTETLQLQNYMHGSGSTDITTLIDSSQGSDKGKITLSENNNASYAPRSFAYGIGYYEQNPVVYNSKLKETTCGKNYLENVSTSMHHQIEYGQGIVKAVKVNLNRKKTEGLIEMDIDENVTEGVVHVGELMTDDVYGWKKPLIAVDENYVGSFKIKKNMKVTTKVSKEPSEKDWLSCCFGGYGGIDDENKKWGEEEIFDCTCRQVAWDNSGWSNRTQAQ